jgi:hypothetical protein
MPIINGIYTKDFPNIGRNLLRTDLSVFAIPGNVVTYKATLDDLLESTEMAASETQPGVVTTGIQNFAGDKYFTDQIWITENEQFGGHIGIVSGSGSLMAPLLGASSETSTYWLQILAHPAPNLYNTNPADGIIFQIYDNEGPDPITAGNAFNFKNGTTSLFNIQAAGDANLHGGLNLTDNRVSNGVISLGSGSNSLLAPSLAANSESSTAWFSFNGQPATNLDNTNPSNAFRFNAFKNNGSSVAMDAGNLVSFTNNNVSKFSVDYNGVITSAGLTNGLVKSTSGVLSNATSGTDFQLPYWSRTGSTLSPVTANDNLSIGSGSITSGAIGATTTTTNAIVGTATTGAGVYGTNTGAGGPAVQGYASGQAIAGQFSNNTSSLPTLFIKQDGAAPIAQFQGPVANVYIGNGGALTGITSLSATTGTSNILLGSTSNYGYTTFNNSTSLTGMLGMFGGATGDLTTLYLQSPSSGTLAYRVASLDAMLVNSSGDLTIAGNNATKASGTAWINPSDLRLKMNVGEYSKGLAEVLNIHPKTWYFNKASGFDQTKKHLSPIAQELAEVMPEMVSTYKGKLNGKEAELLQVDASDMTWLLVKAIQEQQKIIEKLNARITLLESK